MRFADADHAEFEAECGKGTYVRALARDLGRALGTCGHVVGAAAHRGRPLHRGGRGRPRCPAALARAGGDGVAGSAPPLLPVAAGLASLPALTVSRADAGRLARGQAVLLRGRDAPIMEGWVAVSTQGPLVALAEVEQGELRAAPHLQLVATEASATTNCELLREFSACLRSRVGCKLPWLRAE